MPQIMIFTNIMKMYVNSRKVPKNHTFREFTHIPDAIASEIWSKLLRISILLPLDGCRRF